MSPALEHPTDPEARSLSAHAAGGGRIRVGVLGCGLIAQVMHLPNLLDLEDRFEVAALCDSSPAVVEGCADRFGVARTFTSLEALLDESLDALLILTSGDHAPAAIAAAERGLHVFAEKPMCFSVRRGHDILAAVRDAGVELMVGTMRRYDPAFRVATELVPATEELRLVRVTTLEAPWEPYVADRFLNRRPAQHDPGLGCSRVVDEQATAEGLPADVSDETRWCYRNVLLDNLVHEFNLLRGLLGEPDEVRFADLQRRAVTIHLRFGDATCVLAWADLPGIVDYRQEFAFYAPARRVTLAFGSPYLHDTCSELTLEDLEQDGTASSRRVDTSADETAFKRELVVFHEAVHGSGTSATPGTDALRDIALCEAIAAACHTGRPVEHPTDVTALTRGGTA